MFDQAIAECARNFGEPPRRFSLWDRFTYMRTPRPDWLYQSPNDELETLFLNVSKLKANGKVVWAHVIQANQQLFAAGADDHPAEVVYSLDDSPPVDVEELARVAHELYLLKNTKPDDPQAASIAEYLTSEWTRVFGKSVPQSIGRGRRYLISTIYVIRKHLPNEMLKANLLPAIVSPVAPHVVLALPSRYWPEQLADWWRNGG